MALAFGVMFLAGSLAALVRHPIYGLMTYLAVFYIHPPSRRWGQGLLSEFRWSLLAAGVTLIAILLHKRRQPTTPIGRSGLLIGFLTLTAWIGIQHFWALDDESHLYQLTLYLKFVLVIFMIVSCLETKRHLLMFLWTHVTGCFYLGWLAFTSHTGGRLDGVGGPGIDEANAATLQMITGIFVASALFLAGTWPARLSLFGMLPFMVNTLVATVSRSGFLSAAAGGIAFVVYAPRRLRGRVIALSTLAVLLFTLLANPLYWARIETIKYRGADIEGVDTGGGRLEIIQAQWRMFQSRPLGCGHACTEWLSPSYLEERFLGYGISRSSHNTFMTMLVDHGFVGAIFYIAMIGWVAVQLRAASRLLKVRDDTLLSAVLVSAAASLVAIFVGDMFVQYPKFEARIWFLTLLPVILHLARQQTSTLQGAS